MNCQFLLIVLSVCFPLTVAFTFSVLPQRHVAPSFTLRMSSYSVDSSDYSSKDSDFEAEDEYDEPYRPGRLDEEGVTNTKELKPVPMSKNSGNRFVAILWDRLLDTEDRRPEELHDARIKHTEPHVMACRKANLYNETFNVDSMVDVVWSRQLLSSDVRRVIGQIICLESAKLEYVQDFMKNEPLIQWFTGGDISEIPLYRWRHYRDYSLRQDDGRFGTPCMALALDHEAEEGTGTLRDETYKEHLEYLIRTERVICAGSLHLPTQFKDDPSSLAVGDLVMYNAIDRDEAIELIENDPRAKEGLYKSIQVHFYNNLDVTGKFVAEDELRDSPCADLKEAMEIWGYPVHDDQTPWNNW